MNPIRSVLSARWIKLLCIVGAFYAIAVIAYLFTETGKSLGSRDFHQFWYAGHFIRQARDPYEAFFRKERLNLPIYYADGVVVTHYPVAQSRLEITPSNTPAMLLTLTPLSYFSWKTAKWIFLAINLVLMLITGWLALHHIPFGNIKLSALYDYLIFLIYFDFSATRIAIENGQTTLLVFLLMMVALIFSKRAWYISGLALGLALSKYSLSIPIFLFLLYKRNFKVLFLAVLVQLAGVLSMAAISGGTPVKIVMENVMLFFRLFDQPGVHLSRWFEFMSDNHFISIVPSLVMTVLVFIPLFLWLQKNPPRTTQQEEVLDFHVLTILFIWTLLVAYHRLYDTLILIFFVILVLKGLADPGSWALSSSGRRALLAFMALLPLILILPARIVDLLLPFYYGRIGDGITTILLVAMLAISMFLLRRYLHNMQAKIIHKETESHDLRNDSHRDTRPRWAPDS
ncbi:MAG: glycosyltransferase family 87 protein [Bacteroidota bacterium]